MEPADSQVEVTIPVPQTYKDCVVSRQFRWFWFILVGVLAGVNALYYLLCAALHWKWLFHFQMDVVLPLIGLASYMKEVRKPWRYEINQRMIKLFVITPKSRLANLKEIEWAETEVTGVVCDEWQGFPCLKVKVLPATDYVYMMVYDHTEEENVKTNVLPLIETHRRQYRQKLWADVLRS